MKLKRYGKSFQEIADELGMYDRSAARQVYDRAMRKVVTGLMERGWSEEDVSYWIETDEFAVTLMEYVNGLEEDAP